jgi:hypothetical protein
MKVERLSSKELSLIFSEELELLWFLFFMTSFRKFLLKQNEIKNIL